MRIVAISDTHLQHDKITIPDGDILIHAGDFSVDATMKDVIDFASWIKAQPHQYKLAIPGNHDRICEDNMKLCKEILDPIPFEDAGTVKLAGLYFLCYSWTPAPQANSRWKFHHFSNDKFEKFWEYAPPLDYLVTHGPPQGILDKVAHTYPGECPFVGEYYMRKYVLDYQPKIHIFGHIHESYGTTTIGNTRFFNASVCDLRYKPTNPPFVIDL